MAMFGTWGWKEKIMRRKIREKIGEKIDLSEENLGDQRREGFGKEEIWPEKKDKTIIPKS